MSWLMSTKKRGWFQTSIYDFLGHPPPTSDMGGTTGGERVRDSAQESNIIAVWCYDPIRWPDNGPIEPEVFWLHWLAVGDRYPDTEGGW